MRNWSARYKVGISKPLNAIKYRAAGAQTVRYSVKDEEVTL